MLELSKDTAEKLKQKKLVFTVSTGRSGTAFLNWVLSFLPKVNSQHEPEPDYVDVLRDAQKDQELAKSFMCKQKLPQIANEPGNVYVETSHLFCKGFAEVTLDLGITPDIIIHSRTKRDIAKSLFRGETIPGRTQKALRYYLSPADPNVLLLKDWDKFTDYQLCFWYCLEIKRRSNVYRKLFENRGAIVVNSTLESVKTYKGYVDLVNRLQLPKPNLMTIYKFWRCRNYKMNKASDQSYSMNIPGDLEEQEAEVIDAVKQGEIAN